MSKLSINKNISIFFSNNQNEQKNKSIGENEKITKDLNKKCILSLLTNKDIIRNSFTTNETNIFQLTNLDYDFKEIKKFDELNNSLGDISEFDLEKDNDESESEFNSSKGNNSMLEDEEIIMRTKIINSKECDLEYKKEIDKEYEEIIYMINSGINL